MAHIQLVGAGFVADLDDGHHIECTDLLDLARELYAAGVTADSALCGDWREGDHILMSGQQIALRSELRRLAGILPIRLFLDTEFTDFIDCDLISIGIVSDDGREFYAERNDFDLSRCSQFVKEGVLPLLGREPATIGTETEIGIALKVWLAQFDDVEVCVDYSTDWEFFMMLIGDLGAIEMPKRIEGRNIWNEIAAVDVERYWKEYGRQAHHALHDAKALRFAFTHKPKRLG